MNKILIISLVVGVFVISSIIGVLYYWDSFVGLSEKAEVIELLPEGDKEQEKIVISKSSSVQVDVTKSPEKRQNLNKFAYLYKGDVYIFDVNTGEKKQMTTYGYNRDPVLSPDGKKVAFLSVPKEAVETDKVRKDIFDSSIPIAIDEYKFYYNIWILDIDNIENDIKVTNTLKERNRITWSPDSSKIAFQEDKVVKEYVLATGEINTIANGSSPEYSKQGILAYIGEDSKSIVINKPEKIVFNHEHHISTDYYDKLVWSPDGKFIYFTSADESESLEFTTLGIKYAIYAYNLETSQAIELISDFNHVVSVSPDGKYLYGVRGSYYYDAGFIDITFKLYEINSDYSLGQVKQLKDFDGPDYFNNNKTKELEIYPKEFNVWLNNHTLVVLIDQSRLPEPNPRGIYIFDPEENTTNRLVEYNN